MYPEVKTLAFFLLFSALSCNPPAPAPPDLPPPGKTTLNPPVYGKSPDTAPIVAGGNSQGTLANLPFGLPGAGQNPIPNSGLLGGDTVSAISGLIKNIQNGGDFGSILGSVTNLVSSFAGGTPAGGVLSGFGNLLSTLISGQQSAP